MTDIRKIARNVRITIDGKPLGGGEDYAAFAEHALAMIAAGAGETYEEFTARLTLLPEIEIAISNPAPEHTAMCRLRWRHCRRCTCTKSAHGHRPRR